ERNGERTLQGGDEFLHFEGSGTVTSIHIAGHADKNELNLFLAQQLLQMSQEIRKWFSVDEFQWLSDHLELVADRDTDPFCPMIQSQDSHDRFAVRELKRLEHSACHVDCFFEVGFRMCGGNEARFKL